MRHSGRSAVSLGFGASSDVASCLSADGGQIVVVQASSHGEAGVDSGLSHACLQRSQSFDSCLPHACSHSVATLFFSSSHQSRFHGRVLRIDLEPNLVSSFLVKARFNYGTLKHEGGALPLG